MRPMVLSESCTCGCRNRAGRYVLEYWAHQRTTSTDDTNVAFHRYPHTGVDRSPWELVSLDALIWYPNMISKLTGDIDFIDHEK